MAARSKRAPARFRVGRVSVYLHHGNWWVYYREHGKPVRKKVSAERDDAEQIASRINGQLVLKTPTLLAFTPIGIPSLRQQFLDYHEQVLRSSLATIRRYRAATQHLENFDGQTKPSPVHEVRPESFVAYLRQIEVAPNGHDHTAKRKLRDKGIQFILETCRSLYGFAAKRRHLPHYAANPFAELPLDQLKIEDAKPIFVFDEKMELRFFQQVGCWSFPIHALLAKTGLRVGEAAHLLIEDLDLEGGWLLVRNKPSLGWRIKTGVERNVPLIAEVIGLLKYVIGHRTGGPVFLREQFLQKNRPLCGVSQKQLEQAVSERKLLVEPGRSGVARVATSVWRDAGAVKADVIRTSFIRTMKCIGHPDATCPKSWRHTFATLLQDANVDPLIRQLVLGHKLSSGDGLGMTANYTHARRETVRRQIEGALRLWPASLETIAHFSHGGV